jgi:hypothetical protein
MFGNFFLPKILAVYEIMWKNIVEPYDTKDTLCMLDNYGKNSGAHLEVLIPVDS